MIPLDAAGRLEGKEEPRRLRRPAPNFTQEKGSRHIADLHAQMRLHKHAYAAEIQVGYGRTLLLISGWGSPSATAWVTGADKVPAHTGILNQFKSFK